MTISVITSLYEPYLKGGAERVVSDIVDELIKKGHKVIVITTKPCCVKPSFFDNVDQEGVKILRFYPFNLFWFGNIDSKNIFARLIWHILDIFNFHSYFKIKKILKKEKVDVVMTHNLKGMGYTAPLAIKHSRLKHIHTVHDVQLAEPGGLIFHASNKSHNFLKKFGAKIYLWINKKLFAAPDVVIAPSDWLMNFYKEKGFFKDSRKVVMRNPVPIELCGNVLNNREAGKADLNLLYIGQIEDHKGIVFLVNAIKKIPAVYLNIIGEGSRLEKIKKISEEASNIKVYGFVKNSLLNTYFVQNDFLVVPSLCFENSPMVIYESFLNGIPVVASNIGGIGELVKNEYNGYTFKAGNEESLKRAINLSVRQKYKWEELRKNAVNSIKGNTIRMYVDKLIDYCIVCT